MAEVIVFQDKAAEFERDKEAMKLAMAFTSRRKIAERLNMTVEDVTASIARMSGGVTPDFRAREMQLILEQVRELQQSFYIKARQGDYDAAVILLRGFDQVCRMLGLYAPPMRDEPMDDLKVKRTTTEEIGELIDEIRGKKHRTIDNEESDA